MSKMTFSRTSSSFRFPGSSLISLEYFREILALALVVGAASGLLALLQATAFPVPTSNASGPAVYTLGFSNDANLLWVNRLFDGVRFYEWQSGERAVRWPIQLSSMMDVSASINEPITVAIASADRKLQVFRGEMLAVEPAEETTLGTLNDVDVARDGNTVATARESGHVDVYRWTGDKFDRQTLATPYTLTTIRISPADSNLAIITTNQAVAVIDLSTGVCSDMREADFKRVTAVSWKPDGSQFITGGMTGWLRVWNSKTRQLVWEKSSDCLEPAVIACSPDGQWIATGGFDKRVRIWRASTGELHADMGGHNGPVRALAFTSDSDRLVSGGLDGLIFDWSIETRQLIREIRNL